MAVSCISLMVLNTPAFSRPVSRGGDQAQQQLPAQRSARQVQAERVVAASKPALGWPELVEEARRYMGTNPTDRKRLWCATFMNLVLAKLGYPGTNSDAAKSFAFYGRRISKPEVGAIAVLTRGKRGGHVGVVSGIDANGNPVIISGNHNKRVGMAIYPRSRVIAYVVPTGRHAAGTVTGRTAVNRSADARAAGGSTDTGIDSPFAELFAAINSAGDRAEPPRQPSARPASPPQPRRVVQQLPNQRTEARDPPSGLADLFGIREQARPAQQAPTRQHRAEGNRSEQVASDSGLARLFGLPNSP
jgi:uncharacterized protein (TIGR02594 family)